MTPSYDLVVIGAGSAGLTAARVGRALVARVALVERGRIGGDCTWTGCVPSKALLQVAELAHRMRHADRLGLAPHADPIDLQQVMASVHATIDRVYALETPDILTRQGITVIAGLARFVDAHALDVDGRRVHGRRFIICTGSRPALPAIPGLAECVPLTSETIFDLRVLPERLVVLGAGAVGIELAQAFARLGSAVTVIEQAEHILPMADPEASAVLAAALRVEGLVLRTGTQVERVEQAGSGVRVACNGVWIEADRLLVATGRRPNIAELDLGRPGIQCTEAGILVDEHLRTSRRHIYAAGDATGGPFFTHYAGWQGFRAARNALLPGRAGGIKAAVPWVVFTDPQVGQVGLTEAQARTGGIRPTIQRWPVDRIDRAQTMGEDTGFIKLIARSNGTLLGATVVTRAADELTNELALAVERRLTFADLASIMHTYPTYGIGLQQASAAATLHQLTGGWRGLLLRALVRVWP